jgi:hypothetical protein
MVFKTEGSFRALEGYLGRAPAFDELLITLFSHGVDSIGLVPIRQWRSLFPRARKRGDFIGVDEASFPRTSRSSFDTTLISCTRYPRAIQARPP